MGLYNRTMDVPTVAVADSFAAVIATLNMAFGPCPPAAPVDPLDELINTILSQNTNDANRDRAFSALRARSADWAAVRDAPLPEVIETIRPAGLANQKAARIQAVLRAITAERGDLRLDFLRDLPPADALNWLRQFKGVGPKTATIVVLFALGQPTFPVDTHIYRITGRLGLRPATMSAEAAHDYFAALLPGDITGPAAYTLHLNLIRLGREVCRARQPRCGVCPLRDLCAYDPKPE